MAPEKEGNPDNRNTAGGLLVTTLPSSLFSQFTFEDEDEECGPIIQRFCLQRGYNNTFVLCIRWHISRDEGRLAYRKL